MPLDSSYPHLICSRLIADVVTGKLDMREVAANLPEEMAQMSSRCTKITLVPEVLRWARERASLSHEELAGKMDVKSETVDEWESTGKISFAQIDKLADRTYTPSGFLLLSKSPEEQLPMTDYRTGSNSPSHRPSPNLLDTVYQMQSRQSWMRWGFSFDR